MTIENGLGEPLLESTSYGLESTAIPRNRKRKRGANVEPNSISSTRKSRNKDTKLDEEDEIGLKATVNKAFAHMDSQLLADYVAQRTRTFESDLSSVELQDRYLPASAIRDTTSWSVGRELHNLPHFLESFSKDSTKLWSASKKHGAPHTIIIAAAGLRAADLARVVRSFQTKDAKVAKLFAKHIKIQDSVKFLKSTRTGIAVGTPKRLKDLIDEGALQLGRLERLVIDVSHIDQKKRGILEMRDTQIALTLLLGHQDLKARYSAVSNAVEVLFY